MGIESYGQILRVTKRLSHDVTTKWPRWRVGESEPVNRTEPLGPLHGSERCSEQFEPLKKLAFFPLKICYNLEKAGAKVREKQARMASTAAQAEEDYLE